MCWTQNKTLLDHGRYTLCKEIFQAVCDELGLHYKGQGFKYLRSRPLLCLQRDDLTLEIAFWSARYNTPGQHVEMELLPAISSKALNETGVKGGFASYPNQVAGTGEPGDTVRHTIFEETTKHIDGRKRQPVVAYHNRCNLYGINEERFAMLVKFLDERMICWVDRLQTAEGVLQYIENPTVSRASQLLKSNFIKYVELKFPQLDVYDRLTSVVEKGW